MNNQFVDFLSDYGIRSELILPLQKTIMNLCGKGPGNKPEGNTEIPG